MAILTNGKGTLHMAAETRDETIAILRARLGREPTCDEIRAGRKEAIRP